MAHTKITLGIIATIATAIWATLKPQDVYEWLPVAGTVIIYLALAIRQARGILANGRKRDAEEIAPPSKPLRKRKRVPPTPPSGDE